MTVGFVDSASHLLLFSLHSDPSTITLCLVSVQPLSAPSHIVARYLPKTLLLSCHSFAPILLTRSLSQSSTELSVCRTIYTAESRILIVIIIQNAFHHHHRGPRPRDLGHRPDSRFRRHIKAEQG
jgi:hypothetical protein